MAAAQEAAADAVAEAEAEARWPQAIPTARSTVLQRRDGAMGATGGEAALRLGVLQASRGELDNAIDAYVAAAEKLEGAAKGEALGRVAVLQDARGMTRRLGERRGGGRRRPGGRLAHDRDVLPSTSTRARSTRRCRWRGRRSAPTGERPAQAALGHALQAKGDMAGAEAAYRAAMAADDDADGAGHRPGQRPAHLGPRGGGRAAPEPGARGLPGGGGGLQGDGPGQDRAGPGRRGPWRCVDRRRHGRERPVGAGPGARGQGGPGAAGAAARATSPSPSRTSPSCATRTRSPPRCVSASARAQLERGDVDAGDRRAHEGDRARSRRTPTALVRARPGPAQEEGRPGGGGARPREGGRPSTPGNATYLTALRHRPRGGTAVRPGGRGADRDRRAAGLRVGRGPLLPRAGVRQSQALRGRGPGAGEGRRPGSGRGSHLGHARLGLLRPQGRRQLQERRPGRPRASGTTSRPCSSTSAAWKAERPSSSDAPRERRGSR